MLRLRRNEYLVSRLTLDEAVESMEAYNRATKADGVVTRSTRNRTRPRFEIIHRDSDCFTFRLYMQRITNPKFKVAGFLVCGELRNHEIGVSIDTSAYLMPVDLLLTTVSFSLLLCATLTVWPVALYVMFQGHIGKAVLGWLIFSAMWFIPWYFKLKAVTDDLYRVMKLTLNGESAWTQLE